MSNSICVYRHIRLDKNEVFYVGVGDLKRPYVKRGRNIIWKQIVIKTNYKIEIIAENLTREDAYELEELLIQEYGRINNNTGILSNLTDGGDGSTGWIMTDEDRKRRSIRMSGVNNHMYNKPMSEEAKRKASISLKKHFSNKENHWNYGKKTPGIVIDKIKKSLSIQNTNRNGKLVLNLNTGIYYESIQEAANSIGWTLQKLHRNLNKINNTSFILV